MVCFLCLQTDSAFSFTNRAFPRRCAKFVCSPARLCETGNFLDRVITYVFSPLNGQRIELPLLAKNDGLSFNDWFYWFEKYDLSKPLAIIHFTKFRY